MLFTKTFSAQSHRAFSLVEVLVCLALIGILAAVAINWFSSARREILERITNQRNAQEIVSLGVSATMAGADFVEPDDKFATVQNLVLGTTGTTGTFKGQVFRLSSLAPEQIPDALPYVQFEKGLLLYDPAGGHE